ncbi:hypothetical protein CSB89_0515 [Pseudomonas aeruginosa]|nr:hypothetical protein CSB89_0515 [Pseudomonas aeruginosa]
MTALQKPAFSGSKKINKQPTKRINISHPTWHYNTPKTQT